VTWNEQDHPRGSAGRFAEKPHGDPDIDYFADRTSPIYYAMFSDEGNQIVHDAAEEVFSSATMDEFFADSGRDIIGRVQDLAVERGEAAGINTGEAHDTDVRESLWLRWDQEREARWPHVTLAAPLAPTSNPGPPYPVPAGLPLPDDDMPEVDDFEMYSAEGGRFVREAAEEVFSSATLEEMTEGDAYPILERVQDLAIERASAAGVDAGEAHDTAVRECLYARWQEVMRERWPDVAARVLE
jgi:hypothetical protein